MHRSIRALESLLRPHSVTEFQKTKVASQRYRWQVFKVFTWVASIGSAVVVAFHEYPVTSEGKDHVFSSLQRNGKLAYEAVITGDYSAFQTQKNDESKQEKLK